MLYATISELAFGSVTIQLPRSSPCLLFAPGRLLLSNPPYNAEFVTVLGEGV